MTTDEFKEARRSIFVRATEIIVLRKLATDQHFMSCVVFDPQLAYRYRQSAKRKRARADRLEHALNLENQ